MKNSQPGQPHEGAPAARAPLLLERGEQQLLHGAALPAGRISPRGSRRHGGGGCCGRRFAGVSGLMVGIGHQKARGCRLKSVCQWTTPSRSLRAIFTSPPRHGPPAGAGVGLVDRAVRGAQQPLAGVVEEAVGLPVHLHRDVCVQRFR
jgi:hypothetical protein